MKLHNLRPGKFCNIEKGRTNKSLPIAVGRRQNVVSPWLVGELMGVRGVDVSLKKSKG